MHKRLLSTVLAVALAATACGRAPTSQAPGGGDRPPGARETQGTLTLPPGASVQLGDLRVVTAYSESGISQTGQGSGTFTAVTLGDGPQLLIAQTDSDSLVLLGHSGVDDATEINSRTTAEALVFLNPFLVPSSADQARAVLRVLRERNVLAPVQAAVEQQLATSGAIDLTADPLRTALTNAYRQIQDMIRGGAFSSTQRSSSGALSGRASPKPSLRRAAIDPTTDQSGVRLTDGDDPPDDVTYNVLLLNYRRRSVAVAHQLVYNDNTTSNWDCWGVALAKPSLSFGSLLTGEFFEPSQAQFSLQADPQRVREIRVEVLGIGFQRPSPPRDAPLICAANAVLSDAAIEIVFPFVAFLLGLGANYIRAVGRPEYDSRLLAAIADWGGAMINAAPDVVESFVNGDLPNPTDLGRLLTVAIRTLVDTPAGGQLLEAVLEKVASLGGPRLALQVVRAALTRINAVFLVLQVTEFLYNMASVVGAWFQSRAVEEWTITPPQSQPRFYFVATLTWSQPTDLDLYTTAPNGEVAWYGRRVISVGELDYDDIDGYGPENFTLRTKLEGRYQIDVDFYRYSGQTMPSSYRVVITDRSGQQFPCRSGVLSAPGDRVVACFVDLDENGRVTVTPVANAASVRPTDVGRNQVKPARR